MVPLAANTIVDVPGVSVPAEPFQLPLTVTVLALAFSIPPAPMVTAPALMATLELDVLKVVVEDASETVRVPPTLSA